MTIYRTGRKVGRTIYAQIGDQPSDSDELVGVLDTPELAAFAVAAMNDSPYEPGPRVSLRLTATGPGSRPDLVDYVRTVLEQRTDVHGDTSADKLARGIVTSVLSRLGASYSVATGGAPTS